MNSTITTLLETLRAERANLDKAITSLEGLDGGSKPRRGRPPGKTSPSTRKPATGQPKAKRTGWTPAARKAQAQKMRAYWAMRRMADGKKGK